MARPTGRSPRRYSTEKIDGVPHKRVPHCNGCDVRLLEINIPALHHWEPGFEHTRKYPFTEPTFFCEKCRDDHSLSHRSYVLVPMREDQSLRQALVSLLESLSEVSDAHDHDGIGLTD